MKTLFVCFLIKIAEILCYVQEVTYPNSEIVKPDIMYNLTDKNISGKIPEIIADYIINRNNNTTLSENPETTIIRNNLFDVNIQNSTNVKEMSSSADNVKKIKVIKSIPYKYIEVIHYVPIKVTTSQGGKEIILDTNSSLDNRQKVIVDEDGLNNLQNIVNNDDPNKVQKGVTSEENLNNNDLDNIQKVTVKNDSVRRNFQRIFTYKDGQSNMRKTIINNDVFNIDKEALLNSLGFFVIHPPKGDYHKSQIIFKLLLRNFINYLEGRGISALEILEYLRKQRDVTDNGFEGLFTNENNNTKVVHFSDNIHNYLKNEELMRAIEKQALLNSYNYFVHNSPKGEDLYAFNNKETYIIILRDFVKYLVQKGITDLEIMEYLQRAQTVKVKTREGTKETSRQSINNNQELDLNTNDEVKKDITLNENLYSNDAAVLQENPQNYEVFNNDPAISIQHLHGSANEQELKSNLNNFIHIPETSERIAGTSKPEGSHKNIVNINTYRRFKEDDKLGSIKYTIENLQENKLLDDNITSDKVTASTTNLPIIKNIIKNERNNHDSKPDLSIKTDRGEKKKGQVESVDLVKGKDDVNTEIIDDIVDQNNTIISAPLRSLSDISLSNDKLITKNETVKHENVSFELSVMSKGGPENYETLIVPHTTKSILNVQTEKSNNLYTDHKSNKNENIKMKDNTDLIGLLSSEKPNLISIFDIKSPKLNNLDTNTDNKDKKDEDILKDSIDLWTSEKPNLKFILPIESSKLNNIDTTTDNKEKKDKDNIDFIDSWTSEKPNLKSIFHIELPKLNNIDTNTDHKDKKDEDILKDNIDFIDLWTSEKPNLKSIFPIESPKLNNIDTNTDHKDKKDENILKDNIDFIDLWTSEKPNLKSIFPIESPKLNNIDTYTDHKDKKDENILKDNIDFIDLWTSEKSNLISIFPIESPKLNNIDTNTDHKDKKDKDISKDNIGFLDLWTSEKPNVTSILDIKSSKLNSLNSSTHNEEKLSKNNNIYIMKDNVDSRTSETPNQKNVFDIKSPKLKNVDLNNDEDIKINELNYNTDYINKIEPSRDTIINEIIKLREILSELIVVLKLILKEFNPNNIRLYNYIINELLKNELVNKHKLNINTNLDIETNDILIDKLNFLNIILPLLIHSNCYNYLDIQKNILKYDQLNDKNYISLTNNDLKENILFLIKLLKFKELSEEQMMKTIDFLLINIISPVTHNTVRTYTNILNNLTYNLQLALYKSLLSIVF